jgi:hypothetical protein
MFEQLKNLANNVINLQANALSVSVFAIPEIKQFILRLNRFEQLYSEGVDANDKIIGTYSYTTALYSGEETYIYNGVPSTKKFGEPYTLYSTGEFYASFSVRILADGFTIVANTDKVDGDILRFGEILGLTTNSKNELAQKMLPFLQSAIREAILNEVL